MKINSCLNILNFGPIEKANINLSKVNIIAGNNSTGKSTSSKLLFCFLTAMSSEGLYLANRSLYDNFIKFILNWNNKLNNKLSNIELPQKSLYDKYFNEDFLKIQSQLETIGLNEEFPDKNSFFEELNNLNKLININSNDDKKFHRVLKALFQKEFNSDFKKFKDANFKFHGNVEKCEFCHEVQLNDSVEINNKGNNCLNYDNVIYVDSLSVFETHDKKSFMSLMLNQEDNLVEAPYHIEYMSKLLKKKKDTSVYDEDSNENLDKIKNMIYELIDGQIFFDRDENIFKFKTLNQSYSMKNTAEGVKQLGIIPLLLENRQLKNSFLIMDEPEVNLHPEWQVRFAEILVILAKETNIHMYINSHSPHFIEAIEVFTGKYNLVEESKFYLSKNVGNNKNEFVEIKRRNLNVLYDNLGKPYAEIDKIRMENLFKGIE